ncbi:MAG: hypothetical protein WAN66_19980 [Limnoraphis robusta]
MNSIAIKANLNLETNGNDTIIRDLISDTILARVVGVSSEALTERFIDLTSPEIIVNLENDTGIGTEDNFSADPTIIGQVNDASEIVNFRASFSDFPSCNLAILQFPPFLCYSIKLIACKSSSLP